MYLIKGENKMSEVVTISRDKLRSYIERIERMDQEISVLKEERSDIFSEAKGDGFDTKIIRKIVRLRKMSKDARSEEEALLETYLAALGEIL